jgi:DNA polymerase-3 subunit epsilon
MFRVMPLLPATTMLPAGAPADDAAPDFVVIDVETACSNVSSICQVGIVGFRGGVEVFAYETLVDPCDTFSPFNTRIHGISEDHVAGKPTFAHLHATIDAHLGGRVTVAHSGFDKGALAAACRMHDRTAIATTWLDSVRVAQRAWPDLPSHRLNVLAKFLGIRHKHHDALSDARVAGMVVVRAIDHTGVDLAGWIAPPFRHGKSAPKPAADGPLTGERIFILGAPRDGPLAHCLAAAGARVVSAVGATTTMLVVSRDQPFGRFPQYAPPYRRAEELRRAGAAIAILDEAEIATRIGIPAAQDR